MNGIKTDLDFENMSDEELKAFRSQFNADEMFNEDEVEGVADASN